MGKEDEAYIRGFSWGGLFFIILLSLFVCILCFYNATNYGAVLANTDEQLPDTRGNITFYLWLNIVIAIFSLYIFILFLYKLAVGNRNPYKDALGGLIDKAISLNNFEEVKKFSDCKDIGLTTEEQCENFHNRPLKVDKVSYYLENSRYVADTVEEKTNIHDNVYERLCEIKDKAVDCIKKRLQPLTTKELYESGGLDDEESLKKAKEASEKIIVENVDEFKKLKEKIENKFSQLTPDEKNSIKDKNPEDIKVILKKELVDAEREFEEIKELKDLNTRANLNDDETVRKTVLSRKYQGNIDDAAINAKDTAVKTTKGKKKKIDEYVDASITKQIKFNELLRWERMGKTPLRK